MNNYCFLKKFLLDGRRIPELSQIYHHVYFRNLKADLLGGNDLMAKCMGLSDATQLEQFNYGDLIEDRATLKAILDNDEVTLNSRCTKIFHEYANLKGKAGHYISIKSPLYGENEAIGLCGISLPIDSYDLPNFMNIITTISNILQEDWSKSAKVELFESTRNTRPKLTSRELDCLHLYMRGNSIKNIASTLGLSNRTIEFYIDNIKSKFGVSKRSELLPLAFNLYPELV